MNIELWVLQILLAVVFALHGWVYAAWPPFAQAYFHKQHAGVQGLAPQLRIFIGICEMLAAVGLIFPMLTGILPWLTPLAAVGLTMVMVGAVVFHLQHHENTNALVSIILIVLCVIVAYGRWSTTPTSTVTFFSLALAALFTPRG